MRDAQALSAFEDSRIEGDFLEGFLRDQVTCLFELSADSDEIAAWLTDDSRGHPSAFVRLCEAFDADSEVVRREILREFHRRNLTRLLQRATGWERVRDWYLRAGCEDRFLVTMARHTGIAPGRLARQALEALNQPATPLAALETPEDLELLGDLQVLDAEGEGRSFQEAA